MRAATTFKPAASKRARIWPIAFLATASGLTIDSVRSTAIQILLRIARASEKRRILTGGSAAPGLQAAHGAHFGSAPATAATATPAHLLVERIGADVADRGLHRVGLAFAATALAALVATAAPAHAALLLDAALVVGLLQWIGDRSVLGNLAPRLPRLADRAAIERLLQRVGY